MDALLDILAQTSWPVSLPTSLPTSLPAEVTSWLGDPQTRRIVFAAAALVLLVLILRTIGRWREAAAARRRAAALREGIEAARLEQAEIHRLGAQIVATSSTSRIAGWAVLRQYETVFSEPRPTSAAALDLVKAVAVQKGANALINLDTRQLPGGKWVATGDAVLVQMIRPRGAGPTGSGPGTAAKD